MSIVRCLGSFALAILLAGLSNVDLHAEDQAKWLLSNAKAGMEVQLNGLIEGLTARSVISLSNDTDQSYRNLLAKTSCGCVRPKGVDGSTLEKGASHELEFIFVPTAGSYVQTCTISGVGADEARKDLLTIVFRGAVTAPITLERSSILPADVERGFLQTGIKAVADVEIDFLGITTSDEWLSVSGDQNERKIRLSWKEKPTARSASLSVPMKWQEKSYRFSIAIEFIDELISIVPSQLYFRNKGENKVVARAILNAHGVEIDPKGISIRNAGDRDTCITDDSEMNVTFKPIHRSRVMLEWSLPTELIDRFRDQSVVFKVGDEFSNPVSISFQEKRKTE